MFGLKVVILLFILGSCLSFDPINPTKCNWNTLYDANVNLFTDVVNVQAADIDPLLDYTTVNLAMATRCASYVRTRYGLDFSGEMTRFVMGTSLPGDAMPMNGSFIFLPLLFPWYWIYGASTPEMTVFPATNGYVHDVSFTVMLMMDMTVYGIYGGTQGKMVPMMSMFMCGEYRTFNDEGEQIFEPVTYQESRPAIVQSFDTPYDQFDGNMFIECDLFSPQWGLGKTRGSIEFRRNTDMTVNFVHRNIWTFPSTLAQREFAPKVKSFEFF